MSITASQLVQTLQNSPRSIETFSDLLHQNYQPIANVPGLFGQIMSKLLSETAMDDSFIEQKVACLGTFFPRARDDFLEDEVPLLSSHWTKSNVDIASQTWQQTLITTLVQQCNHCSVLTHCLDAMVKNLSATWLISLYEKRKTCLTMEKTSAETQANPDEWLQHLSKAVNDSTLSVSDFIQAICTRQIDVIPGASTFALWFYSIQILETKYDSVVMTKIRFMASAFPLARQALLTSLHTIVLCACPHEELDRGTIFHIDMRIIEDVAQLESDWETFQKAAQTVRKCGKSSGRCVSCNERTQKLLDIIVARAGAILEPKSNDVTVTPARHSSRVLKHRWDPEALAEWALDDERRYLEGKSIPQAKVFDGTESDDEKLRAEQGSESDGDSEENEMDDEEEEEDKEEEEQEVEEHDFIDAEDTTVMEDGKVVRQEPPSNKRRRQYGGAESDSDAEYHPRESSTDEGTESESDDETSDDEEEDEPPAKRTKRETRLHLFTVWLSKYGSASEVGELGAQDVRDHYEAYMKRFHPDSKLISTQTFPQHMKDSGYEQRKTSAGKWYCKLALSAL